MTRMTKAQLVDENIALRHNLERLEAQVAELRAQLIVAKSAAPTTQACDQIVATYTKRDGSVWNKVRVGWNQYVHRPVAA